MYIYIDPSIHPSIHLFVHLSVHLSIHLFVHLSIDPSAHPSVHPFVHLSTYMSACLPVCLSVRQSFYLSIYLPTYLSIYLSIYRSIYRSIYLSILFYPILSIYLSDCTCIAVQHFSEVLWKNNGLCRTSMVWSDEHLGRRGRRCLAAVGYLGIFNALWTGPENTLNRGGSVRRVNSESCKASEMSRSCK